VSAPIVPGEPSLEPRALLAGYARGWFPMDDQGAEGPVGWYEADPRALMPIDGFRVPRSVRRGIRRHAYEVRIDADFAAVTRACAARREGKWLTPRLGRAYLGLRALGLAHSVECWRDGGLVGGLFGVALGGLFTSESMFHRAPDAGSAALAATAARLAERGYVLWDIQQLTPHAVRFGAHQVPAREYRRRLSRALALERTFA
jgi:leucyl/phenylalanyl-tRNA---protein transferase